jgi:hypothetical protein
MNDDEYNEIKNDTEVPPPSHPPDGMWLSTIPTHFNGSVLGNEEFQDGI